MAYSLDDSWDNCGPVARAGNACFGLYSRCGIWSARNLQDGFVPAEVVAGYGAPEQARKLVDVGLWEIVDGGFRAIHFLERNPTAETVRARQRADAERKARWRKGKSTRDKTRDSGGTPNGRPHGIRSPLPSLTGQGARASPSCPHHPGSPVDNCGLCRSERLGAS